MLKTIAIKRYKNSIDKTHEILYEFYKKQQWQFKDKKGKYEW